MPPRPHPADLIRDVPVLDGDMDAAALFDWGILAPALAVAFAAGVIKGVVGFAMPMIMIAGLGGLMQPEFALAGLIMPTLLSNAWQSVTYRVQGLGQILHRYRYYALSGVIALPVTAQLVPFLPKHLFHTIVGGSVMVFSVLFLIGWSPRVTGPHEVMAQWLAGGVAGVMGGISGTWGPATVLMLSAINPPKREQLMMQGIFYGAGSVLLFLSHLATGILTVTTMWFSSILAVAAMAGFAVGTRLEGKLDQSAFRRATLIVLVLASANLIRRGLIG